jgi:hypothetical protein
MEGMVCKRKQSPELFERKVEALSKQLRRFIEEAEKHNLQYETFSFTHIEPSKLHFTTRIVTSSARPTRLQKSASD